jgi:hypothetical protein
MKTALLAAALALAAPAAEAGTWTTKWTGPHGGAYEGGGACDNGDCKAAGTFTGPLGGVWKHAGTAHRTAAGKWEGAGEITGPNGQTLHHQWTWSANGG